MPRILSPRRVPLTREQQREKANKYRISRSDVWVDPYPEVFGTKPEKMVYAELMRRGISFQYVPQINTGIPDLEINQWFKPDFVVPQFKIIIEVQGAYWHTMPDKIASDSLRFALMEMAGYRVLPWWDYDIESRLPDLFDQVPELRGNIGSPSIVSPGRSSFNDDLKGLRASNAKRRKPWTHKAVTVKIRRKTVIDKTAYTKPSKSTRQRIL